MTPKSLMALIAFAIVVTVAILYLTRDEEPFLEPENLGRPDVSLNEKSPETTLASRVDVLVFYRV